MSRASLLAYCLAKPGAWQDEPWEGDEVVKVGDKIFAFFGSPERLSIGLKCGRTKDDSREWRDRYPDDVTVSAYIGRYGWNSFVVAGAVPDDELREAIDLSYEDVVARLPRSKRPADPEPRGDPR
jgi:predicted DNA-binding protein (MmcQ/YjbR family)